MRGRFLAATALAVAFAFGAGCRPPGAHGRSADLTASATPAAIVRGANTYAAYCADCHGPTGAGDGPLAMRFALTPADLRSPAITTASDTALLDRLMRGTPLETPPLETGRDSRAIEALREYLRRLGKTDGDFLRAGRVVYEENCAPCHGVYGRSDTAVAQWVGAPDLIVARERYGDAALRRISEAGIARMPPLYGGFDPTELRALVAYIRNLSDGFAIYDTRCAACHGDDGQGIYSRDVVPPAIAAPPLRAPYPRDRLLAMLRRERGVMPHFADLDEPRLRDVIAYLRASAPRRNAGTPPASHP